MLSATNDAGIAKDSIGWDYENWVRAFSFWAKIGKVKDKLVLELGCGCDNGGLSLWAASQGAKKIVCSDYKKPRDITISIHKKYGLGSIISYASIDALKIPYNEQFDAVIFKSMLGGIVRQEPLIIARDVFLEIVKALKPGGFVLCAENLESSVLHQAFRKRYGAGKNNWRYFKDNELPEIIHSIENLELVGQTNVGFLGCFGRTEAQRRLLGKLDKVFVEKLIPPVYRYIQFLAARKIS